MNCENIDAATNVRLEQLAFTLANSFGQYETFVAGSDGHTFLMSQIAEQNITAPDKTAEQLADCLYAHLLERDSMVTDDDRERLRELADRLRSPTGELDDFTYLQQRVHEEFGASPLSPNRTMTLATALRAYLLNPDSAAREFGSGT